MDWLNEQLEEAIELKRDFVANHRSRLEAAALIIYQSVRDGGKILACGNGGSASDASHFVGEMLGRFRTERMPLPAVCLNSDPATVTAIANDYGYEKVFERQVVGLGWPRDVLLAISTSGNSPNVVAAAAAAGLKNMKVIGLVGHPKSTLALRSTVALSVPGSCAGRIQEVHIFAIHTLCEMVDRMFTTSPLLGR